MKNLLALVGLVVVGFGVVGWYCNWYTLSVTKGSEGRPEVKTTLDTQKVSDDSSAFFQRIGRALNDKSTQSDSKGSTPAGTPGSTPGPTAPANTDAGRGESRVGWLLSPTRAAPTQK